MSIHKLCTFSDDTHWMIGNKLLPNKNFPLVFQSVVGVCEQEEGDKSYFNTAEVKMVIDWIENLKKTHWDCKQNGMTNAVLNEHIGVVSPYAKQCENIRNELAKKGYEDIDVGPAEVFQGREKRVVIISAVRTGDHLGFVKNKQVNNEQSQKVYSQ